MKARADCLGPPNVEYDDPQIECSNSKMDQSMVSDNNRYSRYLEEDDIQQSEVQDNMYHLRMNAVNEASLVENGNQLHNLEYDPRSARRESESGDKVEETTPPGAQTS